MDLVLTLSQVHAKFQVDRTSLRGVTENRVIWMGSHFVITRAFSTIPPAICVETRFSGPKSGHKHFGLLGLRLGQTLYLGS